MRWARADLSVVTCRIRQTLYIGDRYTQKKKISGNFDYLAFIKQNGDFCI